MRKGNFLVLILAIFMGGIAALLAHNWMQARALPAPAKSIVVAKGKLGFGTELTPDNTVEIPWAAARLPEGAFLSQKILFKDGRRVSLAAIDRNEPILNSKITGPGQRGTLSALVTPGYKAVTVRVDEVRGVAGFVLPGDRVDVVLIRAEQSQGGNFHSSDILLQDVKVLAVDQIANEQQEKAKVARAVTLEVSTEDAQKILLATSVGHLSLILRHVGETRAENVSRVTESDLVPTQKSRRVEAPPSQPAAAAPAMATVDIVRGTKRQSYSVTRSGG
jgi:pilus assembly protein CpaB